MADVPNEDDIDDEGETWTEKDKTFLHPCLGLIKVKDLLMQESFIHSLLKVC